MGKVPFDLVVRNVNVVNVYSGEVLPGVLGIKSGRIVTCAAPDDAQSEDTFDGQGMYALPGFIDAHIHIESSLAPPQTFSDLIVPRGTTAVFADPMEIANVAGEEGLAAMLTDAADLPYHLFLEVPSRVPSAPGLETTGGELGEEEVKRALAWPASVSLGEMDPSKVLGLQDEYLAKIDAAHALNMIANGHAPGLKDETLVAYACAGFADDHECVTYEEAKERLRLGIAVIVRDGSTERNLEAIIQGLVQDQIDPHYFMFCTDDKYASDLRREGHIDYMINQAVALGVSPLKATQMATINAARHFRQDHLIGSLSPGRWADVVLTEQLDPIKAGSVFFKGKLVAQEGRLLNPIKKVNYPENLLNTIKLRGGTDEQDFHISVNGGQVAVRVIEVYPDQIINNEGRATLDLVDGSLASDLEKDVLKIAVVERYGQNGNIGIAFVHGFGLRRGGIASSVAHDHHNIVVVGTNDSDMATCVRAIEKMQGGLVAVIDGEVVSQMALPLGGLMSLRSSEEVIKEMEALNAVVAEKMGCSLPSPYMTLSFLTLPTVPDLGLTDKGLVSVKNYESIDLIVESYE